MYKRSLQVTFTAIIALAAVTLSGCGGGNSNSNNSSGIPASVVNDAASLIVGEAAANLVGGFSSSEEAAIKHFAGKANAETAKLVVRPDSANFSCIYNSDGSIASCTFSDDINTTAPCKVSGTTGFVGSISGSVNGSGFGSFSFGTDTTFTDCVDVAGYTINGAPEVTTAGTFTFQNFNLNFPLNIDIGGGFMINNVTCNVLMSSVINSDGSSTTSGTLCGQSVSFSQ